MTHSDSLNSFNALGSPGFRLASSPALTGDESKKPIDILMSRLMSKCIAKSQIVTPRLSTRKRTAPPSVPILLTRTHVQSVSDDARVI